MKNSFIIIFFIIIIIFSDMHLQHVSQIHRC